MSAYILYLSIMILLNCLVVVCIVNGKLRTTKKIMRQQKGVAHHNHIKEVEDSTLSMTAADVEGEENYGAAEEERKNSFNRSILFRTVLSHLQVLSLIADFKFDWPTPARNTLSVASVVSNANI
jgi:ABC-type siderophore export system fused ATPase/permease subunit